MTAKEAYMLVAKKWPELDVVSCYEYDTVFAFNVAPKGFDPDKANDLIDGCVSVNKQNKQLRDFKPFHIPIKEYRAGKQVKDFM